MHWGLLVTALLLVAIGLAAIYSVQVNRPEEDYVTLIRQAAFFGIGLLLMVIVASIDYRAFRSYSLPLYILGALFLLSVLVFGVTVRGTTGWIPVGFGIVIQPVEFVKIFFVLFLARYLSDRAHELHRWKPILVSGGIMGALVFLVLLQPDLGSALVFVGIWIGTLLLLNVRRSVLMTIGLLAVVIVLVGWNVFLKDYQKERIMTFIDPNQDPLEQGYNIRQSIVAVGSGQLFGKGLGEGPQSQLNFLPEQQTDFIFAVVAEELGFVGTALILLTEALFFSTLFSITKKARDDFSVFAVIGFSLLFFIQMFVNIGMNIGVVPIVGLPLPFISAGGSSLIASFTILGILQSVYIHRPSTASLSDREGR